MNTTIQKILTTPLFKSDRFNQMQECNLLFQQNTTTVVILNTMMLIYVFVYICGELSAALLVVIRQNLMNE